MRHWSSSTTRAAVQVADRPGLWLPGALAWTVTVGWLALAVGVVRPPSTAGLTFAGAGIVTSGAWPWNAVALGAAALGIALVAFGLAAAGEASLVIGPRASARDVARVLLLGMVCAAPTLLSVLALAIAIAIVGPLEFNAPDRQVGPLLRTVGRLAPLLAAIAAAASAGAAFHAAAIRAVAEGHTVIDALRRSPPLLAGAGTSALSQAAALLLARLGYLALSATLLRVLWAPIGDRLAVGGMDPAAALLLVGFVAIWLCLVLGGGALHAWGSVSWTAVLGIPARGSGEGHERMETSIGR